MEAEDKVKARKTKKRIVFMDRFYICLIGYVNKMNLNRSDEYNLNYLCVKIVMKSIVKLVMRRVLLDY